MSEDLRVLHLEDNDVDAEFVKLSLEGAGLAPQITRVCTRDEFLQSLEEGTFDLIVSNFSVPGFDGFSALELVLERTLDVPFLFVSGTIGEEGEDRLSRFAAAVRRCLAERQKRRAGKAAEERLREQAALLDEAREAIAVYDLDRRVTYWSRGAERLYGWTAPEARAGAAEARVPPESQARVEEAVQRVLAAGKWDGTLELRRRDGRRVLVDSHWTLLRRADGRPRGVLTISSDVQSEPGQGSEFRVFLPVSPAPGTGSHPPAVGAGAGRLLLLVDEGSVREITRQTLEACGYRVLCPPDAERARRAQAEHGREVAAVIVNVSVPRLEGLGLVQDLVSRTPPVPVLAIAAEGDVAARAGLPPEAILTQPYGPERLLDTVGRVLRQED